MVHHAPESTKLGIIRHVGGQREEGLAHTLHGVFNKGAEKFGLGQALCLVQSARLVQFLERLASPSNPGIFILSCDQAPTRNGTQII